MNEPACRSRKPEFSGIGRLPRPGFGFKVGVACILFSLQYIVLVWHDWLAVWQNQPTGRGALRANSPEIMEVNSMFVLPETRGQGVPAGFYQNWIPG